MYGMDQFENELKELRIVLSDVQKQQFEEYYKLLVEWNEVMNLTAITDYKDVMKNAREKAKQVQLEGTVLMENKNNALPLNQGAKVTFLSYSSAEVLYGSSGSGGITPEGCLLYTSDAADE